MRPSQYCGRPAKNRPKPCSVPEDARAPRRAVSRVVAVAIDPGDDQDATSEHHGRPDLVADHGVTALEGVGDAQVAAQQPQEVQVLHDERVVEAEHLVDRGQLLRGAFLDLAGLLVQQQGGPVAGQQGLDEERDGGRGPDRAQTAVSQPATRPAQPGRGQQVVGAQAQAPSRVVARTSRYRRPARQAPPSCVGSLAGRPVLCLRVLVAAAP